MQYYICIFVRTRQNHRVVSFFRQRAAVYSRPKNLKVVRWGGEYAKSMGVKRLLLRLCQRFNS